MNHIPCPDHETIVAFAAGRVDAARQEALFLHFLSCDACCRSLRFAYECLVADKKQTWPVVSEAEVERAKRAFDLVFNLKDKPSEGALLWLRFSLALTPVREVMAAADGQTPDQRLQAAALSGHISFSADCGKQVPGYWQAKIALPVAPAPETELRIRIRDAKDAPIAQGVFILCGIELPVSDGLAKVRLADLQGHLDKPIVALRFPNGEETAGTPRLFDTENG
jgi:hypothetical protein